MEDVLTLSLIFTFYLDVYAAQLFPQQFYLGLCYHIKFQINLKFNSLKTKAHKAKIQEKPLEQAELGNK